MVSMKSPNYRSWIMSRIRSKNTKPEIIVRSALHTLGFRFRLLSGKSKYNYLIERK
ncbi:MAG: hypothetical protein ACK502_06825 [Alphaproteobacteria bacterium]